MEKHKYLSPAETSALLSAMGLSIKTSTLAKYRCIGGGPKFQLFGRFPKYREDWTLEWAQSRLSAPKSSTSEAA